MSVEQLNADFGILGQLEFVVDNGGLVFADMKAGQASARVSTYAGQVLSYKPSDTDRDVLFLSEKAYYADGKAIKGGVPVCWPWFGPDPLDEGRPGHGYVRNRQWQVTDSEALGDGGVRLLMSPIVDDSEEVVGGNRLGLSIQIDLGRALDIRLVSSNLGDEPVIITQALHTYFSIGDINNTGVHGLEGTSYIDKMDNGAEKPQDAEVVVQGEVDRIYTHVPHELVIDDEEHNRRIHIRSMGSDSAVVWNPWKATAQGMADLGDKDYKRMICVETCNAGPDIVKLAPGEEHTLAANISIEKG